MMPTMGTPMAKLEEWGLNNIAAPVSNFFSGFGFAEGGQITNPFLRMALDSERERDALLAEANKQYEVNPDDPLLTRLAKGVGRSARDIGTFTPEYALRQAVGTLGGQLTARPSELALLEDAAPSKNAKSDVLAQVKNQVSAQPSGPRNEPPLPPTGQAGAQDTSLEQLLRQVPPLDMEMLEERGRGNARTEPPAPPTNQQQAAPQQAAIEELFVNVPVGRQEQPQPARTDTGDGIDYRLLNMGIAMLTSDDDFLGALGSGLASYAATSEKMYEREQARQAGEAAAQQQQFENMITAEKAQNDRIKALAYSRQIDAMKKAGGMTPYQAAQLKRQLARDDLDAAYKKALMGKIQAETSQISGLTTGAVPAISAEPANAEDTFMQWLTTPSASE